MLYPLTFQPIFKERVWGGRRLEELYGKPLPPHQPIGESWEISDRPGDVSIIANGALTGKDLRWLMANHAEELLGPDHPKAAPFPLLVKILDAQERLSLQVHPPAAKAAELKGEPKTEMWYIADALPGAELYVGLRGGMTRENFERKTRDGSVADCFHRIAVKRGDVMFLPSGRVHAIGSGLVIFEIQQNSDTTYRVFDWNRVGLDGKARELHLAESLASIDFEDFEPGLVGHDFHVQGVVKVRPLVNDPLFCVDAVTAAGGGITKFRDQRLRIIALVEGEATIQGAGVSVMLKKGDFCLIPHSLEQSEIKLEPGTNALLTQIGR